MVVFLLATISANAQFVPASATETTISSNSGSRATGNDIFDIGGNKYAVSVWDNGGTGTSGLGYNVSGVGAGAAAFYFSDAVDPDVCLVKDPQNGDVYAIAVYYSSTAGGWICDYFQYISTSFVRILYQPIDGGNYGYSINIDGNFNGDFVIIYDDVSNNLWGVAGTVNGGFYLPATAPLQLTATNIQAPDIAIADNSVYNTRFLIFPFRDIAVCAICYCHFDLY